MVFQREHRHITETGLSLLAQSHLPSSYWVDAFLTSVYLINRLPTPILENQSPYFTLFQKHPDYSLLKTFGCACYPLLRPYTPHKLAFRSKKCLFLGYSSTQKGYRCLDPTTNRVYVSRHVTFDETHFPAQQRPACTPPAVDVPPGPAISLPPGISLPQSSSSLDTTISFNFGSSPSSPASDSPPDDSTLSPSLELNHTPLGRSPIVSDSPYPSHHAPTPLSPTPLQKMLVDQNLILSLLSSLNPPSNLFHAWSPGHKPTLSLQNSSLTSNFIPLPNTHFTPLPPSPFLLNHRLTTKP